MNWMLYALLSAVFAGVTALLAKMGVAEVPSNLATFIRTIVVALFAFAIVLFQGQLQSVSSITSRTWLFLVLSGLATGLSWLFYFAALKYGPLSAVAPIDKLSFVIAMGLGILVLHEQVNRITLFGAALIILGVLLTLTPVQAIIRSKLG